MNSKRGQEGFTLIELMVTILCGTIVTAAAVTILLLGLRMNARNTAVSRQQNQIRIVFTMLEDMVAEGAVNGLAVDEDSWTLTGSASEIKYSKEDRAETGTIKTGESVLMDNIKESTCAFEESLLTVTVTMADDTQYKTTIYCRSEFTYTTTNSLAFSLRREQAVEQPSTPRGEFLSVLTGEIGSTGKIVGTETYYSQWYTDQQSGLEWPEDTPWCACFLSWAAAQVSGLDSVPYFARVNDGVWGFSGAITRNGAEWNGEWHNAGEYVPVAGDFIFFNLDEDVDADHVGAVLSVAGDTVFTVEGNCDGKVAVCSYALDDPTLVGYGVLDWGETE